MSRTLAFSVHRPPTEEEALDEVSMADVAERMEMRKDAEGRFDEGPPLLARYHDDTPG